MQSTQSTLQPQQTVLLLSENEETRRLDAIQTPPPLLPEPVAAPAEPDVFTVGEAVALRREAAKAELEDILVNLCGGWMWEGGEANAAFQRHKIWLKELLFRMSAGDGIKISEGEAEHIFTEVTD